MKLHYTILAVASAYAFTIGGNVFAAGSATNPVWDGFYVGAGMGGAVGDTDLQSTMGGPPVSSESETSGILGGGIIGYNFLSNQLVFGIVADISASEIDDVHDRQQETGMGPPTKLETSYDWIATLRARGGRLVNPNTLLYVHGGAAFASIDLTELGGHRPFGDGIASEEEMGWTVGAGGEIKVNDNASLFLEYSYMDFGEPNYLIKDDDKAFDNDNTLHVFKIGVNYAF